MLRCVAGLLGGIPLAAAERYTHDLRVLDSADWVAGAADVLAELIAEAVQQRGRCVIALSGGSTPAPVFAELATRDLPWSDIVILQVDERIADLESGERNLVDLVAAFSDVSVAIVPLPVEAGDAAQAIGAALADLATVAGDPAILDIVHLGLGDDGHTASLVPGDPILDVVDCDVATTAVYRGTSRLSLTRPILDRARVLVWLVAGGAKVEALNKLLAADRSIPASLIEYRQSIVIADSAAAPTHSI